MSFAATVVAQAKYFVSGEDVGADGELFALARVGGAEKIGAEGHSDSGVAQDRKTFEAGFAYVFNFCDGRGWKAEGGTVLGKSFVGDEGGDGDSIASGGEAGGGIVDEVAVFEGVDAALDGPDDALSGVEVRGDVGLRVESFFHHGVHFRDRIAEPRDWIGGAGDASLPMTLMNDAPSRSCWRQASRTSSTPSAMRPSAPKFVDQRLGSWVS